MDVALSHLISERSLTTGQAAARYGVSERTVRSWCEQQPGLSVRIARGLRRVSIPLCDVWAYGDRRDLADLAAFLEGGKPPRGAVQDAFEHHDMLPALAAYQRRRERPLVKAIEELKSEIRQPRQARQA